MLVKAIAHNRSKCRIRAAFAKDPEEWGPLVFAVQSSGKASNQLVPGHEHHGRLFRALVNHDKSFPRHFLSDQEIFVSRLTQSELNSEFPNFGNETSRKMDQASKQISSSPYLLVSNLLWDR